MKKVYKRKINVLFPILIALSLSVYFIIIIVKYPLIGLEVTEKDEQWIIERIYQNGWAASQPIKEGDILKLIDKELPEKHPAVIGFNRVEMVKSMTIVDENLMQHYFVVSSSDLEDQYVHYLLLPLVFSTITLLLSTYLYIKAKKYDSAKILILFLLSIGLSYLSASVSTKADVVGRLTTIIALPLSLILFIHFLKSYFVKYNLLFIKDKSLIKLYAIYSIVLSINVINQFHPSLRFYVREIELLFFLSLLLYLLFQLIKFYIKNRKDDINGILKVLIFILFLAFGPFILFFAIPSILFQKQLVSAEITASFLIIIPFGLVYLQLANKLFDIEFLLDRIRYYALISLPFTVLVTSLFIAIIKIPIFSIETLMMLLILYIITIGFLYVKEHIDYKLRKHLFSQHNHFENSLYKFFQNAKYETKVSSLIKNLQKEIREVLMVKEVFYVEVVLENDKWIVKDENKVPRALVEGVERIGWSHCLVGALIEITEKFGIVIGSNPALRCLIVFGMKKSKTNLNIQEKVWLETIAYFSSILLENFQLIEDLFEKIEAYEARTEVGKQNYPSWLSRLLFSLSEKERTNLSIDLHDSVLQDQLQLLRNIEKIQGKVMDVAIQQDLYELKERMLDNIHLVRETCNELQPPFLSELGIIQSIQNLIDLAKLRCNFMLETELDESIGRLDREYELALYRVVQELLNNAMKHSFASMVHLSLHNNNGSLSLDYEDNGKGINLAELNNTFKTMGLFGIKERVKSLGGTIEINTAPSSGLCISIVLKLGGNWND